MLKTRYAVLLGVLVFGGISYLYMMKQSTTATLILTNGVIYTLDQERPTVEAIALRNDRIVAVGTATELRSRYTGVEELDLGGKAVYPGLTDAHAHMEGLGAALMNLDLTGTRSVDEIRQRVADRAELLPEGAWLRGRSWDQNDWETKEFPTHEMLDDVAGDRPAALRRVDGHAVWVNKKAMQLAGISRETPDPEGGRIVRFPNGDPTGVLVDNAEALIDNIIPAPSMEERTEAIRIAVQACLSVGLTSVHDMGADEELIGIYTSLIDKGEFPFRVYVAIDGLRKTWGKYLAGGPVKSYGGGKLAVRALKLYADGALGSRGAALIEEYSDEPGNRGLTVTATDTLLKATEDALKAGFQVCIHAIGDRANHIVLNVFEQALKKAGERGGDARLRVEHAQIVHESDIPRFAKLGVLPAMQPTHCTSDMYWAEDRLGPKRVHGAYAWRTFRDAGSIIPGGSDFPVESANPLFGFYAAITRQDHVGWPAGGWYPGQRLTREEALQAFTMWAAFAAFEENTRGTIRPGALADLTILDTDIMRCDPSSILSANVEFTVVAGEIAYTRATGELH